MTDEKKTLIRNSRDEDKWHAYMVAAIVGGHGVVTAENIADAALAAYVRRCTPVETETSEAEELFAEATRLETGANSGGSEWCLRTGHATDAPMLAKAAEARAKAMRLVKGY